MYNPKQIYSYYEFYASEFVGRQTTSVEYQSKTPLHGGAVEIALPNPPLKDGMEQNTI